MITIPQRILARIAHPFDENERRYFFPDPWGMASPKSTYRIEETNRIIKEKIGSVGSIIEVGSGEGHQTEKLCELGTVHGIEVSRIAVERARGRVPQATFEVGVLPLLPPMKADLVVVLETLFYVSDIGKSIEWMNRTAPKRMVSYHIKHNARLEPFLPPTNTEIVYWEGEPRWKFVWW